MYYLNNGASLAFSSELNSVSKFPGFRAAINEEAVGEYLRYGFVPGESTDVVAAYQEGASRALR